MSTIFSRLLMILVVACLMLPMVEDTVAWGQQEAALNGGYNFTMNRHCNTNDTPAFLDITLQGTVTYNGAGAANFQGQSLIPIGTAPDGSQATQDCSGGTYTVDANGRVTHTFNCNLTFTAGPTTGTATFNDIVINGQLSLDGTVILLYDTKNNIETFTLNADPPKQRVCNGSGIATSRR